MTTTFKSIIDKKVVAIEKVMKGLEELARQPHFGMSPDEELRKCSSPELIYIITLQEQVKALKAHADVVARSIYDSDTDVGYTTEGLQNLGKLDDSKGGASFGW